MPPGSELETARRKWPNRGYLILGRLAVRDFPPGGTCSEEGFEALCAWRNATPARRSGSWQQLAAHVPRPTICTAATLSFDYEFVIYSASSDALRVGLLVFLELWLGTYPLSCGSG